MSKSPADSGAQGDAAPDQAAGDAGAKVPGASLGIARREATPEETDLAAAGSPEMRYQSAYVWLIFFSSLDIMLTWAILRRGGEEVNPIARQIIEGWGLHGAIVFKFALMLFVIVSCEVIGRRADRAGRRLVVIAVAISALPVVYSLGLLVDHILLRPTGG